MIGCLIWAAVCGRSAVLKIAWLDACVLLLVGGHVISALWVVATIGDKRSALNLAWEWIGIAIAWFVLRQLCQRAAFRRELLAGFIAAGTVSAGLGLYQHYIDFPHMAAKYGQMFDRLKTADAVEAASIRQALAKDQVPTEGPALILFEKRLRDSREPLGFFALANSLGGFLAVSLILVVCTAAALLKRQREFLAKGVWLCIPLLLIIGWCLLLTKSRTAWVGTAVGLVMLAVSGRATSLSRHHWRALGVLLLVVVVGGLILKHFGGLDRQVLTEAPKSLQYRLQYWSATWRMVKDHVWLGVGPGQFRSAYLFYKRPEASEEISDPHNLFLDVYANGGLIAPGGSSIRGRRNWDAIGLPVAAGTGRAG
jgi:hypothetical protein